MPFQAEGESPQLGALRLSPSAEEDVVVPRINRNRFLLKKNGSHGRIMAQCPSSCDGIGALCGQR